jgi:hypothetical protein
LTFTRYFRTLNPILIGSNYIVPGVIVKRLFSVLALSLILVQIFLVPVIAGANGTCPSITTLPATTVNDDWATLNAQLNNFFADATYIGSNIVPVQGKLEILPCRVYFQYGTSPGVFTKSTLPISISPVKVNYSTVLRGLDPCTTYYVRAVVACPRDRAYYHDNSSDILTAFLSGRSTETELRGLGVGIDVFSDAGRQFEGIGLCPDTVYGNQIMFSTSGCRGPLGQASASSGAGNAPSWPKAAQMSNIVVQSASIATAKVGPGQQVDITASIANTGTVNGEAKVTLYVNGQEESSQGVTLASGQSSPLHFYVSRNEPGTYSVYVGGVPAGSFTVDMFTNNDILIYGTIALVTIGIAGVLYLVTRRRTA